MPLCKCWIAFLFSVIALTSISQEFDWAKTIGYGQYSILPKAIASNQNDEIIIAGSFSGTVDVDPGDAVVEIVADNSVQEYSNDFFVLKLSAQGDFIWVRTFGGQFEDFISSMGIDSQDNILITGVFRDTINLDSNGSALYGVTDNSINGFLLKLDEAGELVWAKAYGGEGFIKPTDLLIDQEDNYITVGEYSDTVDFDPNNGVSLESGVPNEPFLRKIYVQKIDSDGSFIWSRSYGSAAINSPCSIVGNLNNELTISGIFSDTFDVDPGLGEVLFVDTIDHVSIFQSTINQQGDFIDGGIVSSEADKGLWLVESISDRVGNSYVLGYFEGQMDVDMSENTYLLNAGKPTLFLKKQSPNGTFMWGKTIDVGSIADSYQIQVDRFGSVYLMGSFSDTVDFDGGPNEWMEHSVPATPFGGPRDAFILKLNSHGDFVGVNTIAGEGNDWMFTFYIGDEGEMVLAGNLQDTIDVDPGLGESMLTPYGATSYIVKWHQDAEPELPLETIAFPNPFSASLAIQLDAVYEIVNFSMMDSKGSLVFENSCTHCSDAQFDLSGLSHGIYFLHVQQNDSRQVIKLLKL